jgi:large repetitive protein
MTFPSARRRPLRLEQLENRQLMAGDVLAQVTGQMLVLWGDAADNGVMLTYDSATQKYRVSGQDAGGSPTTINGLDTSLPENVVEFSGVRSVYVGLNGGNDNLAVGSDAAVDTVIERWLTIDMGDGDDTVTLGTSGNPAGGAAPIAHSLDIGTSLNVNLGAGNDHLSLANTEVGLSLSVLAGDGDDQVDFDTEFTGPGGAELFPVHVERNATISLGGGADELTLKNATIRGTLTVLDGAGAADIELSNINARKRISINTSGEADQISLAFVRAKQLSMNTNGGIDDVTLSNSKFTTLNIKLGAARDHLDISRTRTSLAAHLDGGDGRATLRSSANALHGLWRRHFG